MVEIETPQEQVMIFVLIGGLSVIGKTTAKEGEVVDPMVIAESAQGMTLFPFARFGADQRVVIRPGMMVIDPYRPLDDLARDYKRAVSSMALKRAGLVLATDMPANITKLQI